MKKVIYYIGILMLIVILIIIYLIYFWKGTFISHGKEYLDISKKNNDIIVSSLYRSTIYDISFIEYNFENNNIYLSFYKKYYKLLINENYREIINLPKKGIYKIYYKNKDGTFDFIKDIDFN